MTTSANKQAAFFAGMFAIAMAGLACAPTAYSASPEGAFSKTITYGDLNINSPSGAKALYMRIRTAAHTLCSQSEDKDLMSQMAWRVCVHRSVDAAVAKINNRFLTAIDTQSKGPAG
jgi:UrcA family protein